MHRTVVRNVATTLCLLGIVTAVFWPGLSGGFIFDDYPNLVLDADWRVTSLDPDQWRRAIFLGISSDAGRPLAMFTFALNHYFTGAYIFPLKLTGLILHAVNVALLFALLTKLFGIRPLPGGGGTQFGPYAAALTSLAWAVHPLQASTVLYIIQRMEVGAHTGVLAALLFYVMGRIKLTEYRRCWPWFAGSVLSMMIGMGFKESALLTPGYALILELFVFRFRGANFKLCKPLVFIYVAGTIVGAVYYFARILPSALEVSAYASRDFNLHERLLTQVPVLAMYMLQIVLPSPDRLLFYYDNFPIAHSLLHPRSTMIALVSLVAVVAAAAVTRNRWPLIVVGIGWFLVSHALTSNVIPLELAFEHRNYFGLLGIIIAAAQVLALITHNIALELRRVIAGALVTLLLFYGVLQANTWSDPLRLSMSLSTRNPTSVRAAYQLSTSMLDASRQDPQSPLRDLAVQELKRASALPSTSVLPEQALIILTSSDQKPVPVGVWGRFREKLAMKQAGAETVNALYGILECRIRGQCAIDDQEIFDTFIVALRHNPNSAVVHSLYSIVAWNIMADKALAIDMMREAVRLSPRELQYKANLRDYLRASGSTGVEVDSLQNAIEAGDEFGVYSESGQPILPVRQGSSSVRD
ncbi:MAG: hypothetical protein ACJ8GV_11855 [Luteimonas sp.]